MNPFIHSRLDQHREDQNPPPIAYDGNSGMTLELDGQFYYRDIQGRYFHAYDKSGRFYEPQIERYESIWHRLEGLEVVLEDKRRAAKYYEEREYKRAPQPARRFLP